MEGISDELLRAGAGIRKYGVMGFRLRFSVGRFPRTGLVLERFFDAGRFWMVRCCHEVFRILRGSWWSGMSGGWRGMFLCGMFCGGVWRTGAMWKVLLDAHDAGLGVGEMVFVTDDRKDIVGRREVICGCLAGVRGV